MAMLANDVGSFGGASYPTDMFLSGGERPLSLPFGNGRPARLMGLPGDAHEIAARAPIPQFESFRGTVLLRTPESKVH